MERVRLSKEFDWTLFQNLCQLPEVITQEDIARCMQTSVDTCARRVGELYPNTTFAEFRRQNQTQFKVDLLNKQMSVALAGNVVMLKWLGINYLGQSENPRSAEPAESTQKLILDLSGNSFKSD